jgi:hypothetical protein
MDLAAYRASLATDSPPSDLGLPLQALWWEAKGDWHKAHECAQAVEDVPEGRWVHAYLHRREGDLDNAGYWYRMAGKPVATAPFEAEWAEIATALLRDSGS